MKTCHEHHERPLLVAFGTAVLLLLLGAVVLPVGWISWVFERQWVVPASTDVVIEPDRWVRLLPAPAGEGSISEQVIRIELSREDDPLVTDGVESALRWTYDPLAAGQASDEIFDRTGVALGDSLLRHAEFLRSLTLTDLDRALAMIDTSQVALAQAQFRGILGWRSQHLGPLWQAQGQAARNAAIFYRAVTEAEREGVQ